MVDGDQLLALFALDLRRAGPLAGDTVVVTVMTNLGFRHAMTTAGVAVHTVGVGDRNVLEALDADGWSLGGEQSGHVIFRGWPPPATACSPACSCSTSFTARPVLARPSWPPPPSGPAPPGPAQRRRRRPRRPGRCRRVWEEVNRTERLLGNRGRVLLRPSGTEPLVRVMVEAPTQEEAEAAAERLVGALHAALGEPAHATRSAYEGAEQDDADQGVS